MPMPSQRGHMPPVTLNVFCTVFPAPRSTVIAPEAVTDGTLKEYALGDPMKGFAEPAVDDAQHRVRIGDGADGGARVRPHALLVDEDRRGQPLEQVDLGARLGRQEALYERAVRLVDEALRLGGDRAEDQRALAGAGHAGEDREPALRDLDADVLEVVDPRALHADQVVAVGLHRSWSSPSTLPSGSVTVATSRPPPTSCGASFTTAPAAVTSASFASMSATCQ